MVDESWNETLGAKHNPILNLSLKLKRLKVAIKRWNKHDFGYIGTRITEETEISEQLQVLSENDLDNTALVDKMEEQESKVENLLNLECSLLKQKAGVKWDHEGE
ncbi:hypothetical protein FRX31_033537, partial [Thalictrum thalictroides]